jgi:hypothetical protein
MAGLILNRSMISSRKKEQTSAPASPRTDSAKYLIVHSKLISTRSKIDVVLAAFPSNNE